MILRFVAIFVLQILYTSGQNESACIDPSDFELHGTSEILSRRKRFIVFPEGSSIQLVFCNTVPSNNVIGDIILFGYTAALAYELPQDPYSPFEHHADPLHRRMDTKEIYYMDEYGKIIHRRKYERKFIVNPAFAKRSVDGHTTEVQSKKDRYEMDRKQMHEDYERELKSLDARSVEFHRTSRVLLYRKIETMLQGLGGNGSECLLKTLCLVGQTQHHPQGSFFQELLRAVFTLPKSHKEDPYNENYDIAHWTKDSCDQLFPGCEDAVKGPETVTVI